MCSVSESVRYSRYHHGNICYLLFYACSAIFTTKLAQ